MGLKDHPDIKNTAILNKVIEAFQKKDSTSTIFNNLRSITQSSYDFSNSSFLIIITNSLIMATQAAST